MQTYYKKHLFFCVNQKQGGKKCCAEAEASELFAYAKKSLKDLSMHGMGKHRVSSAGCLGRCSTGPSLVVYPEGVWYTYATKEDIDEIISEHILNNRVVNRLLMRQASSL